MPHTIITAGLSIKKPGKEQYSSDGYNLSVELDADVENAEQFRAVSKALFAEVKAALEAEISGSPSSATGEKSVDLWVASSGGNGHGGSGNGNGCKPTSRTDTPTATPPADRSSSHAKTEDTKITNRQVKFALGLARKTGLANQVELGRFIHEKLGAELGIYELTRKQGSTLIDILNSNGKGDGGNGR